MRPERASLITHLMITVWSFASTAYHMTQPVDIDIIGVIGLLGIVVIGVALIPLYIRENLWGYLTGTMLNTVIIAICGNSVLDRSYFYSASIYNNSVLGLIALAIAGLVLSGLSFRRSERQSRKKVLIVSLCALVLTASVSYSIHASYGLITEFRAHQIQTRINDRMNELETFDERIAYLVEIGDIPSMVVGIVVDDELVFSRAFGDASEDTSYSCGSVTKMFTATAIMELYENGFIELDSDVGTYLPFKLKHPSFPDKTITIRNLLSHQSGLGSLTIVEEAYLRDESQIRWLSGVHGWDVAPVEPYPTLCEYLEDLVSIGGVYYTDRVWSRIEPGTEHIYSNTNYVLLSAVVEQISGMRLDEYLRENVMNPLEMNDSVFDYRDVDGDYATGYEREYGFFSKTNLMVPDYSKVPGPGGLITTVEDLSRFMISQIKDNDNPVLSEELISMMHEKQVEGDGHINKEGYGLGFTHLSYGEWQYYGDYYGLGGAIGHEGGQIGYSGVFYFVEKEESGFGIIILSNLSTIENGIDFSWYFPVYYRIQTIMMEKAQLLFDLNDV